MTAGTRERGAALLSTLMVVAALSVTALMALDAVTRSTALAKAVSRKANAAWALQSAEALARLGLEDVFAATQGRITATTPGLNETLTFPVPGGVMTARLTDASNCFNLNIFSAPVDSVEAILLEQNAARLQTLLVDAGLFAGDARALSDGLIDWIDPNTEPRPGGAEDTAYASRNAPYRAANQPLSGEGDLGAVLGYTPQVREVIAPLVCARPGSASAVLNINTLRPADAPLLRAIYSDELALSATRRLIEERPARGWDTVEAFENAGVLQAIPAERRRPAQLATLSRYFEVTGTIVLDEGVWPFTFVLEAEAGAPARVIARRTGEP